jgi:hypothetical protein
VKRIGLNKLVKDFPRDLAVRKTARGFSLHIPTGECKPDLFTQEVACELMEQWLGSKPDHTVAVEQVNELYGIHPGVRDVVQSLGGLENFAKRFPAVFELQGNQLTRRNQLL